MIKSPAINVFFVLGSVLFLSEKNEKKNAKQQFVFIPGTFLILPSQQFVTTIYNFF